MSRLNALSAFGRMNYVSHLALYPALFGSTWFLYSQYSASSAKKQAIADDKAMPKAQSVDPDNFNPFSAIPFHNNTELRYRYADTKMHKYLDPKTQINTNDYTYKLFHYSYDHDNEKTYTYNWISMVPSDDAKIIA
tara:strand:+ start:67 stop:474 length:408 start_codon:yes stop_codon:yes gene_type:complete